MQAESIPDDDVVSRSIGRPVHWADDVGLVWSNVFQFAGDRCESVIWRKYAETDQDVHAIGIAIVEAQKARGRDREYVGFISAEVARMERSIVAASHGQPSFPSTAA